MTELKNNAIPGGWENTFEETVIVENIEEGTQYKLQGIELLMINVVKFTIYTSVIIEGLKRV